MSDYNRGFTSPLAARADMSVDAGLRAFMLGVYNKLALGLILSAALAYVTSALPAARDLFYVVDPDTGRLAGFTLLGTVLRFAPLAVILFGAFGMRNVTPKSSGIYYWTVVSLIGAGLGIWMLVYTGASVATTFLVTAAAFGALSLVGYTTKKDLTGFGNFLIMGLVGIIIAGLVNMFLHLPQISFIMNILGVLIFAGLTAYDTQRLKMNYYQMGGDQAALGVMTNYGALNLYLNFINMFQFLLSFMGNRR
jgi:FtsH-binding integral membrane protein